MKLASQKLCFAAATSVIALLVAGCPHKPDRPAPSQTVLGPQTGGPGIDAAPRPTEGFGDLQPRQTDMFDPQGQNRTALQAQTVYFDLNQSDIKPAEREKLKAAKEYLDKNPTHKILLEGHCDWRGTAEYNLSLGDRRANSVKKYLQSIGVPATKLETLSKGSLEANKEGGEQVWAKDRRVDLVVVDPARAGPKAI
jgi:peptidoglycan-associated lipoprotein